MEERKSETKAKVVEEEEEVSFDVDLCIVGSGPNALTVLSGLQEPFAKLSPADFNRAVNNLHRRSNKDKRKAERKVLVLSPSGKWLNNWEHRFDELEITHLRSPVSAHPDMFSQESLMEFAHERGRSNELIDVGVRKNIGTTTMRINEVDEGLFDIPSQRLFMDFCMNLSTKLPHDIVPGTVLSIDKADNGVVVRFSGSNGSVQRVLAQNVVLAIGAPGKCNVPSLIRSRVPEELRVHTSDFVRLGELKRNDTIQKEKILVVGGGLSAVQAAIAFSKKKAAHVTLASRRPLQWRHFDFPLQWFDRRYMRRHFFEFYGTKMEQRPEFIKKARGGGTVPWWYRNQLQDSDVEHVTANITDVEYIGESGSVIVTLNDRKIEVDRVVLGTGSSKDCLSIPLIADLQSKFPVDILGGFPLIEEDLRWCKHLRNVFVVGGLASLRVGPSAANLMGARRAAETIVQSLGAYEDLADEKGANVRTNPYSALFDSDDDEESSDDE
jgi:lysine/ornithine N-monooxygenase